MNLPDAESLSESYGSTHWLIKKHAKDLSNADALVQPPYPGNCFNWVLGHIIAGRNEALTYLVADPVWGEDELARYRTGSEPVTIENQGLTLERLLADLELTQERITATLAEISPARLEEVVETRFGERPVAQHVDGLNWHETYHTGQLELLREMALASR
jgi:hypothetical protein